MNFLKLSLKFITLFFTLIPLLLSCSKSASSPLVEQPKPTEKHETNEGQDSNPKPIDENCLLGRNLQETTGLACVVGISIYSFIGFDGKTLNSPTELTATFYNKLGHSWKKTKDPQFADLDNKLLTIEFPDQDLVLQKIDLNQELLDLWTLNTIVDGNTSSCRAIRSGSPTSCWQIIKSQKDWPYSFNIPEIIPKSTVEFLYDKIELIPRGEDLQFKRSTYEQSVAYCKSLNARLASPQELVTELEAISWRELHRPTAFRQIRYPNINYFMYPSEDNIKEKEFLNELLQMQSKQYYPVPIYDSIENNWYVDSYFNPKNYSIVYKLRNLFGGPNNKFIAPAPIFTNITTKDENYLFDDVAIPKRFKNIDKKTEAATICVREK